MRSLLVFAVLLVLSRPVLASDLATDEAKAHVRRATAAYNLGRYAEAAREYGAAYEQTLDPNLLFNVAQSHRLAGDREKAITAYRSFIRSAPRSEQRGVAENKLRELEQQRSALAPAVAQPESAATVTPPPVMTTPLATTPAAAASRDQSQTEGPAQPSGALVSTPAPEPVRESRFYTRWPFWTAVGAAVAGAVVLGVVLTRGGNSLNMGSPSLGTKEY